MKRKKISFVRFCVLFLFFFSAAGIAQKPAIEWVNIPAGTFLMGSPATEANRFDDELPHQVTLNAFKMSRYEITFDQYIPFCKATGRSVPGDEGWGKGNRPVINVSRTDAMAFADWLGCRLPTEAEWEYAARAGTGTPFSTGNCLNADQANYNGKNPFTGCKEGLDTKKTVPVGSFAANPWGLFDMYGNVWEWCSDFYGDYTSEPQTNPTGVASGSCCIIRGGSWYCFAQHCRSAYRSCYAPEVKNYGIGFRLVSK